jgi:hypothetical protein
MIGLVASQASAEVNFAIGYEATPPEGVSLSRIDGSDVIAVDPGFWLANPNIVAVCHNPPGSDIPVLSDQWLASAAALAGSAGSEAGLEPYGHRYHLTPEGAAWFSFEVARDNWGPRVYRYSYEQFCHRSDWCMVYIPAASLHACTERPTG